MWQALCGNAFELCKQEDSDGDSQVKTGTGHGDTGSRERPVGKMETAAPLKNLLSQYSMRATSKYMLPETIYGKVELELTLRWITAMQDWNLRSEWRQSMC